MLRALAVAKQQMYPSCRCGDISWDNNSCTEGMSVSNTLADFKEGPFSPLHRTSPNDELSVVLAVIMAL